MGQGHERMNSEILPAPAVILCILCEDFSSPMPLYQRLFVMSFRGAMPLAVLPFDLYLRPENDVALDIWVFLNQF